MDWGPHGVDDAAMSLTPGDDAQPAQPATSLLDRGRNVVRRGGRVVGVAMLTLVAFVLLRGLGDPYSSLSLDPAVLVAFGLVAAGILFLRGQEPVQQGVVSERASPPRSPLGILTLSAVFLMAGAMILLGNLGVAGIGIGQIVAAALLVVGLGLFAGVWWGRSRLLMVVGVLLIPVVIVGGFIPFPLRGSVGARHMIWRSIDRVEDTYEILVGEVTLDLLRVRDFPEERTVNFEVAAGNVTIFIPERVGLTVTGDIEWGNATVGHGREQGENLHFANELEGKPGEGHLNINFNGGIASLYVERISRREVYGRPRKERIDGRVRDKEGRGRRDEGTHKDRRRDRATP